MLGLVGLFGCSGEAGPKVIQFRVLEAPSPIGGKPHPFEGTCVQIRLEQNGEALRNEGGGDPSSCTPPYCREFSIHERSYHFAPFPLEGGDGFSLRVEVWDHNRVSSPRTPHAMGRSFPFELRNRAAPPKVDVLVVPLNYYAAPVPDTKLGSVVEAAMATPDGALIATREPALWRYTAHTEPFGNARLVQIALSDKLKTALAGAQWTVLRRLPQSGERGSISERDAFLMAVGPSDEEGSQAAKAWLFDHRVYTSGKPLATVPLPAAHRYGTALAALPAGRAVVLAGGLPRQPAKGPGWPFGQMAAAATTVTRVEVEEPRDPNSRHRLMSTSLPPLAHPLYRASGVGLWIPDRGGWVEHAVLVGGLVGGGDGPEPELSHWLVGLNPRPTPAAAGAQARRARSGAWTKPDAGFKGGRSVDAGIDAGAMADGGHAADAGADAAPSDAGIPTPDGGIPSDAGFGLDGGLPVPVPPDPPGSLPSDLRHENQLWTALRDDYGLVRVIEPMLASPGEKTVLVAGGQTRVDCTPDEHGVLVDSRSQPCQPYAEWLLTYSITTEAHSPEDIGLVPPTISPPRAGSAVVRVDHQVVLLAGGRNEASAVTGNTAELLDLRMARPFVPAANPVTMEAPKGVILRDQSVLLADQNGVVVYMPQVGPHVRNRMDTSAGPCGSP